MGMGEHYGPRNESLPQTGRDRMEEMTPHAPPISLADCLVPDSKERVMVKKQLSLISLELLQKYQL